MQRFDSRRAANPDELARAARSSFSGGQQESHEHRGGSVRELRYKGHRIRIETTYTITVDGRPIGGDVGVNNEGNVHYHSIPNQQFASAVDMVKRIIDLTPPDAPLDAPPGPHEGHAGSGGHGS